MTQFAFIDEVGLTMADKMQPFMAIGMLRIADTSEIHGRLYKLHYSYSAYNLTERKKLINSLSVDPKPLKNHELNNLFMKSRHHEFKYDSLGFPNLHKYKEVLDIVLEYPIFFDCIIVDKVGEDFDVDKYGTYWHAYTKFTKLLIEKNSGGNKLIPILDFLHKPNSEQEIVSILNSFPYVENALQADSECFLLLQVADLLLGTVVFEKKLQLGLYQTNSNKVRARNEFSDYFKQKLDVKDITKGTVNKPIHFNVWNFKPNKKTRDNTHPARPS